MLQAIVKDRPIMSSLSQHSNELLAFGGNKFPLNSHKGRAFSAGVSELFSLSTCPVSGYFGLWMGCGAEPAEIPRVLPALGAPLASRTQLSTPGWEQRFSAPDNPIKKVLLRAGEL